MVLLASCVVPDSVSVTTSADYDYLSGPLLPPFDLGPDNGYGVAVTATYETRPSPARLAPLPGGVVVEYVTVPPFPVPPAFECVLVDPAGVEQQVLAVQPAASGVSWWVWLVLACVVASGAAMAWKWAREP